MAISKVFNMDCMAGMAVMGVGSVNKKMKLKKDDIPNWKRALGEEAHRAQMNLGQLIKARDESRKTISKRKIRKVTA